MSKLTDIKRKIDQLDGGSFQNLCDAYLTYQGYRDGYSLGMKTGTDKTAPGSPDTYFLTADKRYVFVMYTTQKESFIKKATEDIDKCFDSKKTGVSANDVAEIIYCHTYGRLKPGEDQRLRKYCEERGALLTLIGLDQLGNDIFCKYPILARDFLGISIDSGQILPLDIFVEKHDANKMSAPLNTEFLFRNEELEKAKAALHSNEVLLIAGPAGVGKTRFAVELCRQLAEKDGYTVLVIKNNDLQLYDDLVSAIEEGREYLVLVDDANELPGLRLVLDCLPKTGKESRYISKLILTVRDYARKQVMQSVMEIVWPETIKIGTLEDSDIRKLMEACYGIVNPSYTERIVAIAEGNARLAMLAGRIAAEAESLDAIGDASELYRCYYQDQLRTLIGSKTGKSSAGIIAFIQSVHLEHLENLAPVFEAFKITADDFIADMKLLHQSEIVDLCNDKAARISDQSFSNFLIKYVFVEEQVIPLSVMIETCFRISKSRTVYACNVLLNVFADHAVREYVESQINAVWDRIESDTETFWPFFKAFHMVRPTKTLSLMQEEIERQQQCPFDVQASMPRKDRLDVNANALDDIIQILGSFEYHDELSTAVELLLLYYKKRPDLYKQFYYVFAEQFGVDIDSQRFGYYTQSVVVDHLCAAVDADMDDTNLLGLFVYVADHLLKLEFSGIKDGRHGTASFYTFELPPDEPVLEYRKKLLLKICEIYQHGKMHAEIERILDEYGMPSYGAETNLEIVRAEFREVLNFFSLFQEENLYHCIIAQHIAQVAKQIDYKLTDALFSFLNSDKYKIYSVLTQNHHEDYSEGYEQGVQKYKNRIRKLVEKYTLQDVNYLIQICTESIQSFDREERKLSPGLWYVFEALQNEEQLYLHLVEEYMKANTPYKVTGEMILTRLFELMPPSEVKQFITQYSYEQKNVWLWYFYALMPEREISVPWEEEMLHYLSFPDTDLKTSPYRWVSFLHRYEVIDSRIVFKALRIIVDHYEESPFVFSCYVYDILNYIDQKDVEKTMKMFSEELSLLEDIYLRGIAYSNNEDHDGILLFAIISAHDAFLCKYLECQMTVWGKTGYGSRQVTGRLSRLWGTENFIDLADTVFNYLHEKEDLKLWLYGSPLREMLTHRADHQEIVSKQDAWIEHVIEQYSSDENRMYELFSAIEELPHERRKGAVEKFLSLNADPEVFEKLPLESSAWGGWGSSIPYMRARIDYLSSLLPSVSGLKYLRQKQRIERDIESWKERIRAEEIEELLEDWYH